jgi:hypothetical protein
MTGGEFLGDAGRRTEALEMSRKTVAVLEELNRVDPASAENAAFLARTRVQIVALECRQ